MRIGVLSDSHGRIEKVREALDHMGSVDIIFHAGDFYKDAVALSKVTEIPVKAVVGNCDWGAAGPDEEIIELAGRKILLTHGHKYGVKNGYMELVKKGNDEGCDLVVFGHSHVPEILQMEKVLLFNPGSVSAPRSQRNGTYGIIDIKEKDIIPHIHELP